MAEKPRTGAFAEGAERFERLARAVKESQLSRTRAKVGPPPSEAYVLSPEEAWAKKYTTHCIGPVCYGPMTEPLPFSTVAVPLAEAPKSTDFSGATRSPSAEVEQRAASGHIGLALGKPPRQRSWLGRLLRGR